MSAFADHNTRNWLTVAAHNRRGGPMRDRRAPRVGAQADPTRDARTGAPERTNPVCDCVAFWGCPGCNPE